MPDTGSLTEGLAPPSDEAVQAHLSQGTSAPADESQSVTFGLAPPSSEKTPDVASGLSAPNPSGEDRPMPMPSDLEFRAAPPEGIWHNIRAHLSGLPFFPDTPEQVEKKKSALQSLYNISPILGSDVEGAAKEGDINQPMMSEETAQKIKPYVQKAVHVLELATSFDDPARTAEIMDKAKDPDSTEAGIAKSLAENARNFSTLPNTALAVATGGMGTVAKRVIGGIFAGQILSQVPSEIRLAHAVVNDPNSTDADKAKSVTDAIFTGLLGTAAAGSAVLPHAVEAKGAETPEAAPSAPNEAEAMKNLTDVRPILEKAQDQLSQTQTLQPLPQNTKITRMEMGGKSATQIDIPHPEDAGARPIFSGSPEQARAAGYNVTEGLEAPSGASVMDRAADYHGYLDTQAKMSQIIKDKGVMAVDSPEYQSLWKQAEEIKNRNPDAPGMPPTQDYAPPRERAIMKEQDAEQVQKAQQLVPESAPEVGLGAASPKEFEAMPSITSTQNAFTDMERSARGLPPAMDVARKAWGPAWDEAMHQVDQNPQAGEDLVNELNEKARPVSDVENAILLHRQIDLQNQFDKVSSRLIEGNEIGSPVTIQADRARLAGLSDQLLNTYDAIDRAGTKLGQGLAARKMLAAEDFSLAKMETTKRAVNDGAPLTDKQRIEVQAQHDKINQTQKALDEATATADQGKAESQADAATKAVVENVSGDKTHHDIPAERQAILDGLREHVKDDPNAESVGPYIQKLAENFVRDGIRERDPLVDAVHGAIKDIIPGMDRRSTMDAISGYGDFKPLNPDEIKAKLRDLKGQMQQVGKLEDMQKGQAPAKTGVERRTPSDEERRLIQQVNEMKRRGGFNVTDPAKQLKSALDAIKTRLKNSISDLEYQIATKARIVRAKGVSPSDSEVETLTKQRDVLKDQFDQIFTKPGMTDEQRVSLAEKSTGRQIEELERQLRNNELFSKGPKPDVTSATLEANRARIEALKQEREYARELIQPKERKSAEEIALQAMKTRLSNSTADYQERLANSDFGPRPRATAPALDSEALRLKEANMRAKQAFQEGLMKDRLANRSTFQKATDTLTKWRRGFLLSSPVTLAKLTSAAVQRMAITPIEEGVGSALGKLPGLSGVAERAPREGGFNVNAESKAITQGLVKGLQDAGAILKTGKSGLDVMFGRGKDTAIRESDVMPRSVIDFFGQIHGALKAPVKAAEFARSLEKRMAWNMKQGVDVTDPMVQTRLMVEAYKDANRSIFLQDNIVTDAFQRAMSRFTEPEKSTGKPSVAGTVLAGAAKVALPIVKVPTNIVAETFTHATGLVTGSMRLGVALGKGVENLSPDQADLIMRQLKKGSLGAAALLVGYLNAKNVGGYYQQGQKQKPGDTKFGTVKIFGHDIPSFLLHNPLLETIQIGATIRHVAEEKISKQGGQKGLANGTWAAALGLVEQTPFAREGEEGAQLLNPKERPWAAGELAKSLAVPAGVGFVAEQMDRNAKGDVIKRSPKTILQHVETGIPGLRKNVPAKPNQ